MPVGAPLSGFVASMAVDDVLETFVTDLMALAELVLTVSEGAAAVGVAAPATTRMFVIRWVVPPGPWTMV